MSLKLGFVILALAVAPTFGAARECSHGEKQAMSCTEGMVYDANSGSCVATTG